MSTTTTTTNNQINHRQAKRLIPDPIRTSSNNNSHSSSSSSRQLTGRGPRHTYRHINHQHGTIGTFTVRLLEGCDLTRRHWSALGLGPLRHLGLSGATGEVSSFGSFRLGFWGPGTDNGDDEYEYNDVEEMVVMKEVSGGIKEVWEGVKVSTKNNDDDDDDAPSFSTTNNITSRSTLQQQQQQQQQQTFMPSMATPPRNIKSTEQGNISSSAVAASVTPLLDPFDTGSLRSGIISNTPTQSPLHQFPIPTQQQHSTTTKKEGWEGGGGGQAQKSNPSSSMKGGISPPIHYAREVYKSSTVHHDSNPIWIDKHDTSSSSSSLFRIPLRKVDLLPNLTVDGGIVKLEVRLDEEMAGAESLLVKGALSTAVGVATTATSVVGLGNFTKDASTAGMEMVGLSTDRLIGRGYVDLMPLLLGSWEEIWEQQQQQEEQQQQKKQAAVRVAPTTDNNNNNNTNNNGGGGDDYDDTLLDKYGRTHPKAYNTRRRIERMGMLDVWVPLYHPTSKDDEISGKVHLLITYEPNGMTPKRDDVVAFESYARRPLHGVSYNHAAVANENTTTTTNQSSSSMSTVSRGGMNIGPMNNPVIPPLSPLLVIDVRGLYLLLEYATSRTVTSVDRGGNVKSSRYERTHRVRVHRNAVFVIERSTFMDGVSDIVRLPGDVVMSTPIGQDIAEVTAPLVAGVMELIMPAVLTGKLVLAAGGLGVKASLAGASAATQAVVSASAGKAEERRMEARISDYGDDDSGAYTYVR